MNIISEEIVKLTENAKVKIEEILATDANHNQNPAEYKGLRLSVTGGGCSGLTYKMDVSSAGPKDNVFQYQQFNIIIDIKSSVYLKGVILDFQDGLKGKGFVFENPMAKNKCGCGESFSLV